ncbi:MAG: protein kinase, partial [Clostridium sp.]|nr:protein kinase [Clostridium sp.]
MDQARTDGNALKAGSAIGGKYTVAGTLGQGAFGITYMCVDADGREAAVKEYFRPSLCSRRGARMEYSEPVEQEVLAGMKAFVNEGKRLKAIAGKHANIVKVRELLYDNGTVYIAMELVRGRDLDAVMREDRNGRPMGEKEAAETLMPVVDAVDMLHKEKITHLDIKPGNIMLSDKGPVLIDFGLAKHYDESGAATTASAAAGCTPG